MNEQKKELENRDITIRAIQRNFEQLSSMCQADKEQIQALQKKLHDAEGLVSTEEERKMIARFPSMKEAFDALNAKYAEAESKLAKYQGQEKLDKDWKETTDSARKALVAQLDQHRRAAEEAKLRLNEALAAANASQSKLAALDKEAKELRDALKAEQKARAEADKAGQAARADMSKLQALQLGAADRAAQAEAQIKELKARLADAQRRADEAVQAATGAAARTEKDARTRLEKAERAADAFQKQVLNNRTAPRASGARAYACGRAVRGWAGGRSSACTCTRAPVQCAAMHKHQAALAPEAVVN